MSPWLLLMVLLLSFALTAGLRRYALSRSLMDIPNARSSHSVPTPRGGGVSIVVSFLGALVFLYVQGSFDSSAFYGVLGSTVAVAAIGFLDDHGHIPARWRLLGHFAAAAWGLFWLGGLPAVEILGHRLNLGWVGHVLGMLYLVWMLNLYNFMDGIDGIASAEAVCVCLSAALVYALGGYSMLLPAPLVLAAGAAGFLIWNFPPAKIFMGDAGSGFLGMLLGLLALQAAWQAPALLWVWLILTAVFVVDATLTLLRRLARGDKVYQAHRSHAYQYASREVGGHLPVTMAVVVINFVWLLPLALCVMLNWLDGLVGTLLAFAPLVFLALKFHAGEPEPHSAT
jgi:Fuc2NAc and GlcNAc transferase